MKIKEVVGVKWRRLNSSIWEGRSPAESGVARVNFAAHGDKSIKKREAGILAGANLRRASEDSLPQLKPLSEP